MTQARNSRPQKATATFCLIGLTSAAASLTLGILALGILPHGALADEAKTQTETKRVIIIKHDGKMTCDVDIHMGPPPSFDTIDTNHDGMISKDEFEAFHAAHRPPHIEGDHAGPPPEGDKDSPPPPHEGCGPDGPGDGHRMRRIEIHGIEGLDTNKDGKISFEEFVTPMKAHFDEMDANHDGFIDASEMPKHPMHDHGSAGDAPPPPK